MPRFSFLFLLLLLVSSVSAYDYKQNIHNVTTTCTGASWAACLGSNATLCTRDFNWTGAGLCVQAVDNSAPKNPFNVSTVIILNTSTEYNVVDIGVGYDDSPKYGADQYIIRDQAGTIVGNFVNPHTHGVLEYLVPITQKSYSLINITQVAGNDGSGTYVAYMFALNISFPGVNQPGINQLPTCSLTYPQDTFFASNSTQYFNYTFTVTDSENDQLYYSEGERTDTGRYIVDELNFNTFDICSSPRISSPGHNLSCASDFVTASLVTSHLLMPAVTIAQVDLTHYLFLTAGASFRYTLEKPLIQDGSIAFGIALQNGNVVNVTLVNGIGQEVYSLLFNQTNDWLNVSNGTAIVISESSTHYSPEHKDNWINVLISTYPNSSKIRTSVDTRQDAGKVWQTTNSASLYSVQWSTPADQDPWFWMMVFAKFSGYEYDPGLAFTTTPPDGHRILDWTGGKWLTFYGSDAYHQPTEFCQKDVYVTVLNTNNPLGTSTFGLDNTTPASPYDALAAAQGAASIYTAIPGSLVLLQGAWSLLYFLLFMYFWYCSGFKDFFTSMLIASVLELALAIIMQLGTNLILTACVLLAFSMIPQFSVLFMPGTANKNSGRGGMH